MPSAQRNGVLILVLAVAIATAGACSSDGDSSDAGTTSSSPTKSTGAPQATYRLDDTLRLNEVQVLGSHNSYHASPYPEVLNALRGVNAATAAGLDYGHRPLPAQFDVGVRQIELDVWSTCLTFVLCLRAVKTWSDAHPGHVPIMIEVEMKDATEDVTPATFDALEAEIRSVFAADDLVTPDDVRGSDPSLGHAVRTRGWPTLGE